MGMSPLLSMVSCILLGRELMELLAVSRYLFCFFGLLAFCSRGAERERRPRFLLPALLVCLDTIPPPEGGSRPPRSTLLALSSTMACSSPSPNQESDWEAAANIRTTLTLPDDQENLQRSRKFLI